jgi:hypothetical protein
MGAIGAAAGAAGAVADARAAGAVAVIAATCPGASCAILASRFSPAAKFMISVCGLTEIVCACADEIADAERKMAAVIWESFMMGSCCLGSISSLLMANQ